MDALKSPVLICEVIKANAIENIQLTSDRLFRHLHFEASRKKYEILGLHHRNGLVLSKVIPYKGHIGLAQDINLTQMQ